MAYLLKPIPTPKLFKIKTVSSSEHWRFKFSFFIANIRGFQIYFPRKEFDYERLKEELLHMPLGSRVLDEGLYS